VEAPRRAAPTPSCPRQLLLKVIKAPTLSRQVTGPPDHDDLPGPAPPPLPMAPPELLAMVEGLGWGVGRGGPGGGRAVAEAIAVE
jgi:hypothetical protein